MNDAISHRGPDSGGTYVDRNVAFAHRRLSIIDVSDNANQPLKSNDGNIVIIFNGEIYNHNELRVILEKEFEFKTDHSDTETIIYSYKKWGIKCIEKFTGMFAFALYDKVNEKVYLVRDRFGKKPLYYFSLKDKVYFSSEIYSFFKSKILAKELNEEAIYHYLTFLTVKAPQTFYKNIHKLEPGFYLEISKENINKVKYWDIADYLNQETNVSYKNASQVTETLLAKSMQYRNISDVPIAVALSGGLDSSLNLHYSSKINPDIFSINISYNQHSEFDESFIAKKYCNESHVKFYGHKIDHDDFEVLINEYLSIQKDMPIGDPNTVLMYLLSKIARQNNAKVLLVGEGGDELGGYPIYSKLQKEYERLKNIPAQISGVFKFLPSKKANKLDFFYNGKIVSKRQIHGFTEFEKKQFWCGQNDLNSYKVFSDIMSEVRDDLKDSFLRQILNIEYKLRLPELILARIDYPTMANGIEARSPFMDHKLIEYSCTLPFSLKMKNGPKSLLKDISKNKLPAYILDHSKVGFGMLLTPFLKETMPEWFKRELLTTKSPVREFINVSFLKSLHNEHLINKNNGFKMWIIYALNKWMKVNNF